jgi:hypothetical protein
LGYYSAAPDSAKNLNAPTIKAITKAANKTIGKSVSRFNPLYAEANTLFIVLFAIPATPVNDGIDLSTTANTVTPITKRTEAVIITKIIEIANWEMFSFRRGFPFLTIFFVAQP